MQDNLAAVGAGCAQLSYESSACVHGAKMEIPCCNTGNHSCTYRPGLVTGVLCCRLPGETSLIWHVTRQYITCTAQVYSEWVSEQALVPLAQVYTGTQKTDQK